MSSWYTHEHALKTQCREKRTHRTQRTEPKNSKQTVRKYLSVLTALQTDTESLVKQSQNQRAAAVGVNVQPGFNATGSV